MHGIITRHPEELQWPEFDIGFYETKSVSGHGREPIAAAVNTISCFGDNLTARQSPDLVPVTRTGEPATTEQPYFDWCYICPSQARYRDGLFEMIDVAAEANPDVRLDDVGFPRQEYCHCSVCKSDFEESKYESWSDWRASVITSFVREAAVRIPGRLLLTLYPDPMPGHLYTRAGIDLEQLNQYVDEFIIPLYDMSYSTTYWLEVLASGFDDILEILFSIELYAVNVDLEALLQATSVVETYADNVYFGYDASNARAVLRRRDAASRDGVTHK